jgi:hypothetical protein
MCKIRIPAVLSVWCVVLLFSCRSNDLIPKSEYPDFSIVEGDTVKTRIDEYRRKIADVDILSPKYFVIGDTVITYRQLKLHTAPAKAPDLSNIKNNDNPELKGKPLRYIAVGGSLTAGVRDGGYFNEGIQTSYPNLVARQMRLEKFEQPLFDASDYNGIARKTPSDLNYTGSPVPKFKIAKNNSGIELIDDTDFKLKKYLGNADNLSVMNLTTGNAMLYPLSFLTRFTSKEGIKRFAGKPDQSYSDLILEENFDLISFETGWQEIWYWHVNRFPSSLGTGIYPDGINDLNDSNVSLVSEGGYVIHGKMTFMKKLHESKKAKYGYFLNLPVLTDLPYFHIISKDDVNKVIGVVNKNMMFKENVMILPTSEIDSLLGPKVNVASKKGLSFEKRLSEYSYLTEASQRMIINSTEAFNQETVSLSKSFNFPIVDINGLYKSILKGTFVTDDGVRVDGSYPKGNFFSSDAIYPTAFGQAVIANEVIKTLNKFYKMQIPLINTREYLNN